MRSGASPARLMQALEEVTPHEMPLARLLGAIRYLPALLGRKAGSRPRTADPHLPFLASLLANGSLVLERAPGEVILGTVGRLHQIRDQEFVTLRTPGEFAAFAAPDHERLAMSVRAIPVEGGTVLVLEHRTQATDSAAEHRFRRYWRVIRPGGAFATRQLLQAVARRAESRAANTPG